MVVQLAYTEVYHHIHSSYVLAESYIFEGFYLFIMSIWCIDFSITYAFINLKLNKTLVFNIVSRRSRNSKVAWFKLYKHLSNLIIGGIIEESKARGHCKYKISLISEYKWSILMTILNMIKDSEAAILDNEMRHQLTFQKI